MFDFAVFGAGPAGLSFAIAARRRGARVAVVDRPVRSFRIGEVVPGSISVPLAELDLVDGFRDRQYLRSHGSVSLWGSDVPAAQSALFSPHGSGWHVDRDDFETWLVERAAACGVAVRRAREVSAHRTGRGWRVRAGATTFQAACVLEASGRGPGVVVPGERRRTDGLVGLLAYVPSAPGEDPRFHLEAAETGWWYSAPLPGGRTVFAFMTDATRVPSRARARCDLFGEALSRSEITRARPSAPRVVHSVRVAPANGAIRSTIAIEAALAIGDAAASYDPLCGQGVVAAMSKGAAAARLLCGGGDRDAAMRAYVETERAAFVAYLDTRASLYGATGKRSAFWVANSDRAPIRFDRVRLSTC